MLLLRPIDFLPLLIRRQVFRLLVWGWALEEDPHSNGFHHPRHQKSPALSLQCLQGPLLPPASSPSSSPLVSAGIDKLLT